MHKRIWRVWARGSGWWEWEMGVCAGAWGHLAGHPLPLADNLPSVYSIRPQRSV
jgi:hypothetical protein